MVLSYYGLSCFKLEADNLVIALAPFAKDEQRGISRSPRFKAQVVLIPQSGNQLYNNRSSIEGEPLVFDAPGEYEVGGVFINGIAAPVKLGKTQLVQNTIFSLKTEEIVLVYLGGFKGESLPELSLERLERVDILLVPIGGGEVAEVEQAVGLVNQLEPKIVIPMQYQLDGLKLKLNPLEAFVKEINLKPESLEKFSFKKLGSGEELRLINLKPQGF